MSADRTPVDDGLEPQSGRPWRPDGQLHTMQGERVADMSQQHNEACTSENCWIPDFIAWADGETDELDLTKHQMPGRLQELFIRSTIVETLPPVSTHALGLLGEEQWALRHPHECRADMDACPVYRRVIEDGQIETLFATFGAGTIELSLDDEGELVGDKKRESDACSERGSSE